MGGKVWWSVALLLAVLAAYFLWFRQDNAAATRSTAEKSASTVLTAASLTKRITESTATCRLAGRVVSADDDRVVPNALVRVTGSREIVGEDVIAVEANGEFSLTAPQRKSWLYVAAPNFKPLRLENPGCETDLLVRLERGGIDVFGKVSDIGGGGIGQAVVSFANNGENASAFALTDNEGNYRLTTRPGTNIASVRHPTYADLTVRMQIAQPIEKNFSLIPGSEIQGRVVNRAGEPVAKARIVVSEDGRSGGGRMGTGLPSTSDDQGRFVVKGLESGTYSVRAFVERGSAPPVRVTVGIGEQQTGVVLRMGVAYLVAGKVVFADTGDPAAGALVSAMSFVSGTSLMPTAADDDGVFYFHGVQEGDYMVAIFGEGLTASMMQHYIKVKGADSLDNVFKVERGNKLSGRVVPARQAQVKLEPKMPSAASTKDITAMAAAGMAQKEITTEDDGSFHFSSIPPYDYRIIATTEDGLAGETEATVAKGTNSQVEVVLKPSPGVYGTVRNEGGDAVVDVQVNCVGVGVNGEARTDGAGSFFISRLSEGKHTCTFIGAFGQQFATRDVDLAAGERKELTIEVREKQFDVQGTVVDDRGAPVDGALVKITMGMPRQATKPAPPAADSEDASKDDASGDDANEDDAASVQIERYTRTWLTGNRGPLQAVTDASGKFRIADVPDTKGMQVFATSGAGAASPPKPIARYVKLQLPRSSTLVGRLLHNGNAVKTYEALIKSANGKEVTLAPDPDGTFVLRNAAVGKTTVYAKTSAGLGKVETNVEAGRKTTVEVALEPYARLRFRVVDGTGQPVKGASVVMSPNPFLGPSIASLFSGDDSAATNAAGELMVNEVAPGKHEYNVVKTSNVKIGAQGEVEVRAGEEKVVNVVIEKP